MDWQTILTAVIGVGTSIVGWLVRDLKNEQQSNSAAIRSLETELNAHKIDVAKNHATKHDLGLIDSKLDKMNDKLDRLIERD